MVLVSWQSLADTSALKKGIVLNNRNAVACSLCTRSLGQCITMCPSLQTMTMFSIIVSLSAFAYFLSGALFASCLLFFQPGSCDSRECRVAGWLSSGWSQHLLPTASRIWLHYQQARWKVETSTIKIDKMMLALYQSCPMLIPSFCYFTLQF